MFLANICALKRSRPTRALRSLGNLLGILGFLVAVQAVMPQSFLPNSSWIVGQEAAEAKIPEMPKIPETPERKAFEEAKEAMRKHVMRMREKIVHYHLSESDEFDKTLKEDWMKDVAQGRVVSDSVYKAAIAAYRADPVANADLGDFMYSVVEASVEDDSFEICWPLIETLIAMKYEDAGKKIYNLAGVVAFSLNKFPEARSFLEKAKELNVLDEFGQRAYYSLDDSAKHWEQELVFLKEDQQKDDLPRVLLRTSKGEITVELFEDQAPGTTANFISLVESKFYDGLMFHRVVQHLVAQSGDPEGDGTGGANYTIVSEAKNPNRRSHYRGYLGLALSNNDPTTGGSQFYFSLSPLPHLDQQYTVFGRVISGVEILADIVRFEPPEEDEKRDPLALSPDVILEAKVIRKRNHEYKLNYSRPPKEE